jgi:hypothetical protein
MQQCRGRPTNAGMAGRYGAAGGKPDDGAPFEEYLTRLELGGIWVAVRR